MNFSQSLLIVVLVLSGSVSAAEDAPVQSLLLRAVITT
jgi:hypothetical protein